MSVIFEMLEAQLAKELAPIAAAYLAEHGCKLSDCILIREPTPRFGFTFRIEKRPATTPAASYNSDYAAALNALDEYEIFSAQNGGVMSVSALKWFCQQRLNSAKPNCA